MQFDKVVSQKYKQLFSPSYFIRRLRLANNINLNSYLSALSFFRLVVRQPILSLRRKRPVIVRRSSLYNRVFREKFYKKKVLGLRRLRNFLTKKYFSATDKTISNTTNLGKSYSYNLRLLRRKKKIHRLVRLAKKKIRFSSYKKNTRSFVSNLNPLSTRLLLESIPNFGKTYALWLKTLRITPLRESSLTNILYSLRANSPRKKARAFFKKKLLPLSTFSRIAGKKIVRSKLYKKGRRSINNDYFVYDMHRSRLFSFSLYSFLLKNYLCKKKSFFQKPFRYFVKKNITRRMGFYKAQKFNLKIVGTSTFKIPKKLYISKNLSKLFLKPKSRIRRSRRAKFKPPVTRYRVRRQPFVFNRIKVKKNNLVLNPYLKFIYRKIKRRSKRRLKRLYFFIKRRRRFKLFLRRKKHKKKSLYRSSKISYRFSKENLNFIRRNPPLNITALLAKKKRRFKRKIRVYNFANRNLARTSIALSKVDKKLFRRKRFSYNYRRILLKKNLRRFNKRVFKTPNRDREKSFLIRLSKKKKERLLEPLQLKEPTDIYVNFFRRKRGILNRLIANSIKPYPENLKMLISIFKFSKVRYDLNPVSSFRKYDYALSLWYKLLLNVKKDTPSLFSRESLLSFVNDKISLLQVKFHILFSAYSRSFKDSTSLVIYNAFFKNVFSSILYIKNIILSTEVRRQELITRAGISMIRSKPKLPGKREVKNNIKKRVNSMLSKIRLFIGSSPFYKTYRKFKSKKQNKKAMRLNRLKIAARKIRLRNLKIRFKKLGFIRKTQFYNYTKRRAPILRNRSDIWVQPNAAIHNFRSLLAKRGLLFKAENLVRLLTVSVKFNRKLKKFKTSSEISGDLLIWFLSRFRPMFGVKPRRKGSAIIQTPMLLTTKRSVSIGHRQFIKSVGKRPEYAFSKRIISELIGTVEKRSSTYKTLTEQLKLTYANRVLL